MGVYIPLCNTRPAVRGNMCCSGACGLSEGLATSEVQGPCNMRKSTDANV